MVNLKLKLRRIILFTSLLLLLGHTVVGHSHQTGNSLLQIETSQSDQSVLDWLKSMFLADIGNHHLEDLQLSENPNFADVSIPSVVVCPCRLSVTFVKLVVHYNAFEISDSLIFPSNQLKRIHALRGSPLYS